MSNEKIPTIWTALKLARLVKQLRDQQKTSGSGYKTPAGAVAAKALEQEVDAAIQTIEKTHLF